MYSHEAVCRAGVILMHCPHGIILDVEVLNGAESPVIIFNMMMRFMTEAPGLIIYDNACTLMDYCFKRAPGNFKHTVFKVDRFHFCNHTACSEAFSVEKWPPETPVISAEDIVHIRNFAEKHNIQLPATIRPITYGDARHIPGFEDSIPLNTQITEQNNSQLRHISTPLAFMTHENYYFYMLYYTFRFNVKRMSTMFGVGEVEMLRRMHESAM